MERMSEGGSALVINHGGVVELGVVACLAETDFSAWGDAVELLRRRPPLLGRWTVHAWRSLACAKVKKIV
jgi:hypothetical protein